MYIVAIYFALNWMSEMPFTTLVAEWRGRVGTKRPSQISDGRALFFLY